MPGVGTFLGKLARAAGSLFKSDAERHADRLRDLDAAATARRMERQALRDADKLAPMGNGRNTYDWSGVEVAPEHRNRAAAPAATASRTSGQAAEAVTLDQLSTASRILEGSPLNNATLAPLSMPAPRAPTPPSMPALAPKTGPNY